MDFAIHNPLPQAFLAARRPLLVEAARKVFGWIPEEEPWDPEESAPVRLQAQAPEPPQRNASWFEKGRTPPNRLDLTEEERAARVKAQKRAWRRKHSTGRPAGRPKKADLLTRQGMTLAQPGKEVAE